MVVKSLQGGLFGSPDGDFPLVGGFGETFFDGPPFEELRDAEEDDRDLEGEGLAVLRSRKSLPLALGAR